MKKEILEFSSAPAPDAPYSHVVKYGDLLFVSGQTAETNGTIEEETEETFSAMKALLEEAGSSMDDILKVTIYLRNKEDFARMNAVYAKFFSEGMYPARICTYGAELYGGLLVEADCIAAAGK